MAKSKFAVCALNLQICKSFVVFFGSHLLEAWLPSNAIADFGADFQFLRDFRQILKNAFPAGRSLAQRLTRLSDTLEAHFQLIFFF